MKEKEVVMGEIEFSEYRPDEIPEDERVSLYEMVMGHVTLANCSCKVICFEENEGGFPHFHLKGDINAAIGIFAPVYFRHGVYTDTLTSKQKKELNKWLDKKAPSDGTNWDRIKKHWITHNVETVVTSVYDKETRPDYRELP